MNRMWLLALLLPGGSLIALGAWLTLQWTARQAEAAAFDQALAQKRAGLDAQLAGQVHDETKCLRAESRRRMVAYHQRQAAQVASGQETAQRIRLVG